MQTNWSHQSPPQQLAPATALVQLLTEYPHLADVSWRIEGPALYITLCHLPRLGKDGFAQLCAFRDVLGGSVRAGQEDVFPGGETRRLYELAVTWRDVAVVVTAYIPVEAASAGAVAA